MWNTHISSDDIYYPILEKAIMINVTLTSDGTLLSYPSKASTRNQNLKRSNKLKEI